MRIPPFFPRGSGPLCSILIPTRTRPEAQLEKVVTSCVESAGVPEQLEFLIKVDSDDPEAKALAERLAAKYSPPAAFKVVTMERGRGYMDLHH